MRLSAALPLVFLAAGLAQAEPREVVIAGWDQQRGWFSGLLTVAPSAGEDEGVIDVTRVRSFVEGGELERLSGRGRLRSNWIRADLRQPRGLSGSLEGPERPPVVLQVKFDLAKGTAETVSWVRGRRVSRGRGRTIGAPAPAPTVHDDGEDAPANPHPDPHAHELIDPLDPYFAGRSASPGDPSIEGTDAEGYHSWPGVPYVKGRSDDHAVAPNDVRQGALGDCYLLAALIATARTDPDVIESMIEDHGDGSYSVKLWDVGAFSEDARLTIDDAFPFVTRGTRKVPAFARFGDRERVDGSYRYELWPLIIEKAWARFRGGYGATEDWHSSGPLSFVSGAPVTNLDPANMTPEQVIEVLEEAEAGGHPVVMSTDNFVEWSAPRREAAEDLSLVEFHAYAVAKVSNGKVRLYNPWGSNHPRRGLTGEELQRLFMCIHVGRF